MKCEHNSLKDSQPLHVHQSFQMGQHVLELQGFQVVQGVHRVHSLHGLPILEMKPQSDIANSFSLTVMFMAKTFLFRYHLNKIESDEEKCNLGARSSVATRVTIMSGRSLLKSTLLVSSLWQRQSSSRSSSIISQCTSPNVGPISDSQSHFLSPTSRPASPVGPDSPGGPAGPGAPRSPTGPTGPCFPGSPCRTTAEINILQCPCLHG